MPICTRRRSPARLELVKSKKSSFVANTGAALSKSIDSFINTYVQALHDQTAAIFAGAGLSIPAGLVNWKDLLKEIASDIGLDVDKEDDLVTIAQFHVNERGGRHRINQALIQEFATRSKLTTNHD